jgi:hypothetical protein
VPTKSRRENKFVEWFLSAYEDYSWADAQIDWVDEKIDGAVEALATRKSDGKTVAIEHTIIEPFLREKEDFAFFEPAFLKIEKDTALPVPGRWIRVFVPTGILRGQRHKLTRDAIVEAVHCWIGANRLSLPSGGSSHPLKIAIPGKAFLDVTLGARVVPLKGPGKLNLHRQQMERNLGDVIERALKKKLPKLVGTVADRRILFLERQHMNLYPEEMLREIEARKSLFPSVASVDEIWILETMFYDRDSYLRFEHYDEDGELIGSLDFSAGSLLDKFENGVVSWGSQP